MSAKQADQHRIKTGHKITHFAGIYTRRCLGRNSGCEVVEHWYKCEDCRAMFSEVCELELSVPHIRYFNN